VHVQMLSVAPCQQRHPIMASPLVPCYEPLLLPKQLSTLALREGDLLSRRCGECDFFVSGRKQRFPRTAYTFRLQPVAIRVTDTLFYAALPH
jgi:hypothetical protein